MIELEEVIRIEKITLTGVFRDLFLLFKRQIQGQELSAEVKVALEGLDRRIQLLEESEYGGLSLDSGEVEAILEAIDLRMGILVERFPCLPKVVDEAKESEESEESFEEKILAVVADHHKGISLVDIGNELGVDWRGLIITANRLVAEKRIDKTESLYYPKT